MSVRIRRVASKSIVWSSQKVHKRNFDKFVKSLDFFENLWYNIYTVKGRETKARDTKRVHTSS